MMPDLRPMAQRLKDRLKQIERRMLALLDISPVKHFRHNPDSGVLFVVPPHYWDKTNDDQKRIQLELKSLYDDWIGLFRLLFSNAPRDIVGKIEETHTFITNWINLDGHWGVPATSAEAKHVFSDRINVLGEFLDLLNKAGPPVLVAVPDTNALISNPDVLGFIPIAGQDTYHVVLVPPVLSELDKLKVQHRDRAFRAKVEGVINRIKGLRTQGQLLTGVTVNKTVRVRMIATEPDFKKTLSWLDPNNMDDRIIASALEIQRAEPSYTVLLVTADINLQNKAEQADLPHLETP